MDENEILDEFQTSDAPEEAEAEDFDLEEILKEFADDPDSIVHLSDEEPDQPEEAEEPEEPVTPTVTGDTIRMDTIRVDTPNEPVRIAKPVEEEPAKEPFTEGWEPEYEQPMGEYVPPQPIQFRPRSRLRELKRKLVAGPERRYYQLSEKGLGKLQVAIFLSLLVVLISAGSTVLYALNMVQESRMRLMVFGQFLAMLVSALLGSFQLIDGVADLFKGRFTLNTMLVYTFILCCADGVLCLQQLRVPCCAAFSLEVLMSLWHAYQRRNTEMGQMDTMRKAIRLDALGACEDYYEGRKGFVRFEGQVEHFMERYDAPAVPEKVLGWYGLAAMIASLGIGVTAYVFHGLSAGVQAAAIAALAAVPASAFVAVSRPFGVLERRLHKLGTVLCGWQGVRGLCGKAVFPLTHEDLFPLGTVKLNGVKYFGERSTDEVVAYAAAVMEADGGGLAPLFVQLLESRNGIHYDASDLQRHDNGGISATVNGEQVLVGGIGFLQEMDVAVPEGIRVSQAVCIAINGELSALYAMTYEKMKANAAGLGTLCGTRKLKPVLVAGDFMLTESFIRGKFNVSTRRLQLPTQEVRAQLRDAATAEQPQALLLTTKEGLAPFAYGVSGARALRTASRLGVTVHMIGGILGIAMMLALVLLGRLDLMTPSRMFLYHLVWLVPGLLITEWTRSL